MALVTVNNNNKFLSSATSTDFIHGSDADRYKTFVSSLAGGGMPLADTRLVEMAFNKIKQHLGGISDLNSGNMKLMLGAGVAAALGVGGNILNRMGVNGVLNTICGDFDLGIYSKFSLNIGFLDCLSLSGLLASLLCMGIKGALSGTLGVAQKLNIDPRLLTCVVGSVLNSLGFKPIANITVGLSTKIFSTPKRQVSETRLDINGIIQDVRSNDVLLNAFKDTGTAETLLVGSKPSNSFPGDLDALMSDWEPSKLSGSKNVGNNLKASRNSVALEAIDNNITEIKKEEYMMLL